MSHKNSTKQMVRNCSTKNGKKYTITLSHYGNRCSGFCEVMHSNDWGR